MSVFRIEVKHKRTSWKWIYTGLAVVAKENNIAVNLIIHFCASECTLKICIILASVWMLYA